MGYTVSTGHFAYEFTGRRVPFGFEGIRLDAVHATGGLVEHHREHV